MKYYAIVGLTETPQSPSALIRYVKHGRIEHFDRFGTFCWIEDPVALKYFVGIDDDAEGGYSGGGRGYNSEVETGKDGRVISITVDRRQ